MNEKEFLQNLLRVLNATAQLESTKLEDVTDYEWKWARFIDKQVDAVCAMLQAKIDDINESGE